MKKMYTTLFAKTYTNVRKLTILSLGLTFFLGLGGAAFGQTPSNFNQSVVCADLPVGVSSKDTAINWYNAVLDSLEVLYPSPPHVISSDIVIDNSFPDTTGCLLIEVQWTVEDTLTSTTILNNEVATFEVIDNTNPDITGVPVDTFFLPFGAALPPTNTLVDSGWVSDCSPISILQEGGDVIENSANCQNGIVQVVKRTYEADDVCGNQSPTFTLTFAFTDTQDPVFDGTDFDTTIVCDDPALDPFDLSGFAAPAISNFTDNAGPIAAVTPIAPGTLPAPLPDCNSYQITRTWVGNDACGNSSDLVTQTITVIDTVAPVIMMGAVADTFEIVDCFANLATNTDDSLNLAEVTDNCSAITITFSDQPLAGQTTCFGNGQIVERTWVAEDACGNQSSVTQVVAKGEILPAGFMVPDPINDTIYCEDLTAPERDDLETKLVTWYNTTRAALKADLQPGICDSVALSPTPDLTSVLGDLTDSLPYCYNLAVSWAVNDTCGFSYPDILTTYTVLDTVGPVFSGVPANDTINIEDLASISGAVVTALDGCSGTIVGNVQLDSVSTQGSGCDRFNFTITRTWTAEDSCGNISVATQVITVQDTTPPEFGDLPGDLALIDTLSFINTTTTGFSLADSTAGLKPDVLLATDNSGSQPILDSVDVVTLNGCDQDYQITRYWILADSCDNRDTFTQVIFVVDTLAPTAIFPADTVVSCEVVESGDFTLSGAPTNVFDNADANPVVAFQQVGPVLIDPNCPNQDTIFIEWSITDACGNVALDTQRVITIDTTQPDIVTEPMDMTLSCVAGTDIEVEFQNWVNNQAGAAADDNCSPGVTWEAKNVGDGMTPSLISICGSPVNTIDSQTVWFVAIDQCGNRDSIDATFRVVDNEAPQFITPAATFDGTLPTDNGQCTNLYNLPFPEIQEDCAEGFETITISQNQPITGAVDPDVRVSQVDFVFDLSTLTQPVNAVNVTLEYALNNVDADLSTERFDIIGQDGSTLLGVTNLTSSQCGDTTGAVNIPVNLFNQWAAENPDSLLTIFFRPQTSPGFSSEINNICTNSSIDADLVVENKANSNLLFEYSLNGATRVVVPIEDISATQVTLELGANTIEYFLTDCAGNESLPYSFTVTIEDNEFPVLQCPPNQSLQLIADNNCEFENFDLPLPLVASDNCPSNQTFNQLQPSVGNDGQTLDLDSAYLNFVFDFDNQVYKNVSASNFTFSGLTPNALNPVSFEIKHRGNFDDQDYQIVIDAANIGAITIPLPSGTLTDDCLNENVFTVDLTPTQYNNLVSAGNGTITASIQPVNIHPTGTQICGDTIDIGGGVFIDSSSYLAVNLTYTNWAPTYVGTGATTFNGQFESPDFDPQETFNLGVTNITYSITDAAGNTTNCNYNVTVTDNTPPQAIGKNEEVIVVVNPGQQILVLDPLDFDNGSSDNCTADGDLILSVNPAQVNCSAVANGDQSIVVTLTVEDEAGLTASDQVSVRLVQAKPAPSYNLDICSGDTLFLFANPPDTIQVGGNPVVYTYFWQGPDGFVSTDENPFIVNPDPDNAGSYTVEIFGDQTGCSAQGIVQVAVDDLSPSVITQPAICQGEAIVLTSSITPPANPVYNWYEGFPGSGTLLASTNDPQYVINNAPVGSYNYYLIIQTDLCTSEESEAVNVVVNEVPVAAVVNPTIEVCEDDFFTLSAVVVPGASYTWTGPAGFFSAKKDTEPILASSLSEGTYELQVSSNGCVSNIAQVVVTVLDKPATPEIAADPLPEVCVGGTVSLKATGNSNEFYWITPQLDTIQTTTGELPFDSVTMMQNGNWRVFLKGPDCFSDDSETLSLIVNPLPQAQAGVVDTTVCENGSIQLIGSPTLPGALYNWSGPAGVTIPSGQNPVIQGAQQSFAGTYTLELETVDGCIGYDSVVISIIESVEVQSIAVQAPECSPGPATVVLTPTLSKPDDGSFSYNWIGPNGFISNDPVATVNGASVLSSGPYSLEVTDDNGCTSPTFIQPVLLTFAPQVPARPSPAPGEDTRYCVGETLELSTVTTYVGNEISYHWVVPSGDTLITAGPNLVINDVQLSDGGAYGVFATVDGCPSALSATTAIAVNIVPVAEATNNGPVCEGSELVLTGTQVPGATYAWQGPGFQSNQRVAVIPAADRELNEGDYEFTVFLNGCSSTDTTTVVVKDVPPAPVISDNGPICLDKSAVVLRLQVDSMTAEPQGTYYWSGPFGYADTTTELVVVPGTITGLVEGTYEFEARVEVNECISPATITEVTFNEIPEQEAFAGLDTAFCAGTTVRLSADAPSIGTGNWSVVDPKKNPELNISDPTNPTTSLNGLIPGKSYTLLWTLSNGACLNYDADEVNVEVNEIIELDAGPDLFFCEGEEISLEGVLSATGSPFWTQEAQQEDLGITIVDPSEPTSPITGAQSGNTYQFTWTLETACGPITDEMLVTLYDNNAFAGNDFEICNADGEAVLDAAIPQGASTGKWSTTSQNAVFENASDPKTRVFNLDVGVNGLIWTLDNGRCGESSTDVVLVTRRQNPVAVTDTAFVEYGSSVAIAVIENDIVPNDETFAERISLPQFGTISVEGDTIRYFHTKAKVGVDKFTYRLITPGCDTSVATVRVFIGNEVLESETCRIPSIITPNNDDYNDVFEVPCLADGTNLTGDVVIFNRWGDEVYRADNYQNDWRGTFNGEDLPTGTYFYIVTLSDGSDPLTGYVYIKR